MKILLVEDEAAQANLIATLFKETGLLHSIYRCSDGEEAMDFLHQRNQFSDAPIPDLVLLDLNLPRKDGREVLKELKSDPMFKHIPVVILTTSSNQLDIRESYGFHANSFIVKPSELSQLEKIIKSISEYWAEVVALPSPPPPPMH